MPKSKKKIYLKDESFDPIYHSINFDFLFRSRVLPGIFASLGIVLLVTQVILPLIFFKTHEKVTPEIAGSVLGVATGFNYFQFTELTPTDEDVSIETTKAMDINTPKFFYLSIPKLNIKNAVVETNAEDLGPKDKLGHYKHSALPGQKGNTFIYGHSVLPWFFNPKNYMTIFSTLDRLDTGDKIIITYNNVPITYRVEYEEIQKPADINPLAEFKPDYSNESTLTLMTCWPPGTKSKRFMIRAVRTD
ncbi:class E sortase [Patescibacteria group bacterium]|nr:class E sortase [Patescibacteria group bacterium]